MKKYFVFVALIAFCFTKGNAQDSPDFPIDEETGHVKYQEVVKLPGTGQTELFKRANNWFSDFYKNPGSVIQKKDAEKGLIKGKKKFDIFRTIEGKEVHVGFVNYEIAIGAKDGRYRYTVDELYFIMSPRKYIEKWFEGTPDQKALQAKYLEQVKTYVDAMIANIKKTMATVEVLKDDDW